MVKKCEKHIQNLECFPKHFRQFFKAVAFKSRQTASKPKSRRCLLHFVVLFLQEFVTIVTFRPAARDMFNKIKPCWNRNFVWRVSIKNTFKHQVMLSTHVNTCQRMSYPHLDRRCSHPGSQYLPPQSVYSQGCHDRSPALFSGWSGTAGPGETVAPWRNHRHLVGRDAHRLGEAEIVPRKNETAPKKTWAPWR